MKKIIFCIQNYLIEEILSANNILDDNSIVIRNKKDLSYDFLKTHNPEFIMFPHWSSKVDNRIVNDFKCICFHSSPLPYGRGGSPIQNMIIRGHNETEVCSLLMVEDFDAGPIFLRTKIKLDGKLDEILQRVYQAISDQILDFMNKELQPESQKGKVTIFKRILDNRILFNKSLKEIYNKIRMLDSDLYPNPYIDLDNKRIEFYNAELENNTLKANIVIKDAEDGE
tara:strand:- start:1960 stop:2637 length:678 start_codon:yes stop_codon:yes gene_type:complete